MRSFDKFTKFFDLLFVRDVIENKFIRAVIIFKHSPQKEKKHGKSQEKNNDKCNNFIDDLTVPNIWRFVTYCKEKFIIETFVFYGPEIFSDCFFLYMYFFVIIRIKYDIITQYFTNDINSHFMSIINKQHYSTCNISYSYYSKMCQICSTYVEIKQT